MNGGKGARSILADTEAPSENIARVWNCERRIAFPEQDLGAIIGEPT
jgi:hypothetical protein